MIKAIIKTKLHGFFICRVLAAAAAFAIIAACTSFVCTADASVKYANCIKVGLSYGTSTAYAVIHADSGFRLGEADEYGIAPIASPVDGETDLILRNAGDSIAIEDFFGNKLENIPDDGSMCFISANYFLNNEPVVYGDREYRGGITAVTNPSGGVNVINVVDIEDYTKGVLNREIGHTGGIEALKAQAVTARSYAVVNSHRHGSDGFDVCTGTHCQSYDGVGGEYSSTNRAVEETEGMLLYYNGVPVAGYYFSNSGGATENSEDVWGSEIGYLRGVADEFSPDNDWEVSFTRSQIEGSMSSYGIGRVESVTVDAVNESGYVASVTVKGSGGSVTVEKDRIRSMFSSSLKSRLFTIGTEGGTVTSERNAVSGGGYYCFDGELETAISEFLNVITEKGLLNVALDGLSILSGDGNKVTASYSGPEASPQGKTTVYLDSDSDKLIISGKGFGHGVGMSQDGALVMAGMGYDFTDILKYYYTDIEVK